MNLFVNEVIRNSEGEVVLKNRLATKEEVAAALAREDGVIVLLLVDGAWQTPTTSDFRFREIPLGETPQ